jgi:hypothetical protein
MGIPFATIDVDMDEALVARYGDCISVILAGERELVRAPFTLLALRRALEQAGLTAAAARG